MTVPGKPTPTQAEQDRHALGERLAHHEDDGSGPTPHGKSIDHRLGRVADEEKAINPPETVVSHHAEKVEHKTAEAEGDHASYKTRESHPDKKRSKREED